MHSNSLNHSSADPKTYQVTTVRKETHGRYNLRFDRSEK